MRLNAPLGTSQHGPPHPFIDAGIVTYILRGIYNAMVKRLFIVKRGCYSRVLGVPKSKNPEDSNLARQEAM
jgi:hypothetical protein